VHNDNKSNSGQIGQVITTGGSEKPKISSSIYFTLSIICELVFLIFGNMLMNFNVYLK